jgi:hypothetical protein
MPADCANNRVRAHFNIPPESRRECIPIAILKSSHRLNPWRQALTFDDKSIPEKKKLASGVVRFGFNLLMTGRCQGGLIVAEHGIGVPGDEIVANLVSFAPSLFEIWCIGVDQDTGDGRAATGP